MNRLFKIFLAMAGTACPAGVAEAAKVRKLRGQRRRWAKVVSCVGIFKLLEE